MLTNLSDVGFLIIIIIIIIIIVVVVVVVVLILTIIGDCYVLKANKRL